MNVNHEMGCSSICAYLEWWSSWFADLTTHSCVCCLSLKTDVHGLPAFLTKVCSPSQVFVRRILLSFQLDLPIHGSLSLFHVNWLNNNWTNTEST
jgi:hypothetical protein